MKYLKQSKRYWKPFLFIFIGILALFLGYKTKQFFSPPEEIIVEMEALPAPPSSHNTQTGQFIYESHCAACHNTGATGAPRLDDQTAWAPRIAQGNTVLLQHVIQGYNLMPPKGACLQCSDTDLKMAISYMVSTNDKKS